MLNTLKRLVVEEQGQGMAEYGLILAGIAVVCIVVIKALGLNLVTLFTSVSTELTS
ncbi:MAG: Flp family type IVb pilin [Firmicutes bacterium HGW-Firmicutes-15]|nr:MAG: Flp family type IVb pilin [Firmicutes bacterium HGW-Firmicutes-15]